MSREKKRGIFSEVFSVIGDAYLAAVTVAAHHRTDARHHHATRTR